ncbi:3338_t:CDS:2 [Scutellospora calospora]|uniref:3338_t:CDS:1 n=1 Tax=Scutellospora calospora TaxID=85575 RepID=A0ACA9KTL5_9GLOM|nr:3338_t:CDS:2 [Scutellospora calospora]
MHTSINSILLFLILFTKYAVCYAPGERFELVAAIIANKLYFCAGVKTDFTPQNDLFYIDLNQQFDASDPPFQFQNNITSTHDGSAVVHESKIVIFGGGLTNRIIIIDEPSGLSKIISSDNSSAWPSPRRFPTA